MRLTAVGIVLIALTALCGPAATCWIEGVPVCRDPEVVMQRSSQS